MFNRLLKIGAVMQAHEGLLAVVIAVAFYATVVLLGRASEPADFPLFLASVIVGVILAPTFARKIVSEFKADKKNFGYLMPKKTWDEFYPTAHQLKLRKMVR